MHNQLEPLLWLSIKVSIEAGKEVMRIYNGEVVFVMKSDSSPLTLADISSHRIISEGLLTTKIPILSEEGKEIPYEIRSKWEYLWLIDPLDGTKEFKKRNGEFTTLVYDFFIQITA